MAAKESRTDLWRLFCLRCGPCKLMDPKAGCDGEPDTIRKDPKIRNLSTWPTFEYREMESETKMSCFIQFWCHQVTHWDALKVKELSETFEGKASFLKARLWCCVSVLFSNVEQPLQPVEVIMFFSTTWITCTLLVMDCALFPGDGRQGDTWWVTWVTCQENLRLTLR